MNGTIKVGGWTGWGSGAKRNGGDPPHRKVTVYPVTVLQNIYEPLVYIFTIIVLYK
jgi:hypothetical protein